jgi:hypothetical protein
MGGNLFEQSSHDCGNIPVEDMSDWRTGKDQQLVQFFAWLEISGCGTMMIRIIPARFESLRAR